MRKLTFKKEDDILPALCASDQKMAMLINTMGDIELVLRTDYFPSLVRSIIGQQLSVKAAQTIWGRLEALCKDVTTEVIAKINNDVLKSAGISGIFPLVGWMFYPWMMSV